MSPWARKLPQYRAAVPGRTGVSPFIHNSILSEIQKKSNAAAQSIRLHAEWIAITGVDQGLVWSIFHEIGNFQQLLLVPHLGIMMLQTNSTVIQFRAAKNPNSRLQWKFPALFRIRRSPGPHGKALLTVFFWGTSFSAAKIALNELPIDLILLARLLLAILFLTCLAFIRHEWQRLRWTDLRLIILLAIISLIQLGVQLAGLRNTTAALSGLIIGITPMVMSALGFLFFKEKLRSHQVLGMGLACSGLIILFNPSGLKLTISQTGRGNLLVLASAILLGIHALINKQIVSSFSPILTTLWQFIIMFIMLAPYSLSCQLTRPRCHLSPSSIIAIAFLGFLCSGIASFFWSTALAEMPAVKVGIYLYLEPFFAILSARLLLSEKISWYAVAGGMIVTSGVMLVNHKTFPQPCVNSRRNHER